MIVSTPGRLDLETKFRFFSVYPLYFVLFSITPL